MEGGRGRERARAQAIERERETVDREHHFSTIWRFQSTFFLKKKISGPVRAQYQVSRVEGCGVVFERFGLRPMMEALRV
jgi:hypothetical protein